tara:strand:- start:7494 stop:7904 length:411 start_codon:yes stop_codon:yes gene_type:complete
MYSLEDIYLQALEDEHALTRPLDHGVSIVNNGVKLQKFLSKTEILNCSKNGDYYQELTEDEYSMFFIYGWNEGGVRLSLMNYKKKLDMIEERMRIEINTRKNDKHIKKLKATRESLLIKYSKKNKQLNKLTNGKQF